MLLTCVLLCIKEVFCLRSCRACFIRPRRQIYARHLYLPVLVRVVCRFFEHVDTVLFELCQDQHCRDYSKLVARLRWNLFGSYAKYSRNFANLRKARTMRPFLVANLCNVCASLFSFCCLHRLFISTLLFWSCCEGLLSSRSGKPLLHVLAISVLLCLCALMSVFFLCLFSCL